MILLGNLLREIRREKKLRQKDIAKKNNISIVTYSDIEKGRFSPTAPSILSVINSSIFTKGEKSRIQETYKTSKENYYKNEANEEYLKEINQIKKDKELARVAKNSRRKEDRLIRNKPNFYKKLDKLGDLSKIDVNDPELQDIRESVSGVRYWKGEN